MQVHDRRRERSCGEEPCERLAIVRWAARMGAVTADAVAERAGISAASASARMRAATQQGLLSASRPLSRRPALYAITRAGVRACGEHGLEPCEVSAANAEHLIACATIAARLERRLPSAYIAGERELRREERERRSSVASAKLLRAGEHVLHRPDLVIWDERDGTLPIAVEVELTVKARRRLTAICTAWARCRQVAGVIYLVSGRSEGAVKRAVQSAGAEQRIAILPLEALAGWQADTQVCAAKPVRAELRSPRDPIPTDA